MTTYKDAGVDIELGDDASKVLYNAAKLTWNNRKGKLGEVFTPFDDFTGLRVFNVGNLPASTVMCLGLDGVGTKIEIAERLRKHDTVAYDLFAMVCDDAAVRGGEPALVGSILDVNKLGMEILDPDREPETTKISFIDLVKQLATGYIGAAKQANVAIINGEVAELGARVSGQGEFNYNWGAACVWFANSNRMLTGRDVREGDYVVSLREHGFRSNGLSLARLILRNMHSDNWHNTPDGKKYAEELLTPSRIYCAAITDMVGGVCYDQKVKLNAVAHITGGGIPGKLERALRPSGLGAIIHSPWEPCDLMTTLKQAGDVPDKKAYETWNMGNGMMIVTPQPELAIKVANAHGIEAKVAGIVTNNPQIIIHSYGKELTWD